MPRAFISYSWDSDEHKEWVRILAARLRGDGVETVLDQWHLVPGDQLPAFMEKAICESDYVLIVCTPHYKDKSEKRLGGVGYEGDIITGQVLTTRNERKFIPILRKGNWSDAAPIWLVGKYHVDLRNDPYTEQQYQDLVNTMLGIREQAPPVRKVPERSSQKSTLSPTTMTHPSVSTKETFDPIQIVGVIIDEIGTPRGDGTPGSALYSVPFRFSRRPPTEWSQLFILAWNHPSSYTSMHRPGIAQIYGDTVILNGTTVEEIEKYHRVTLLLATNEANTKYMDWQRQRQAEEACERTRLDEHAKRVEVAAKRLKF